MMSDTADRIMRGLEEALAHAQGDDTTGLVVHIVSPAKEPKDGVAERENLIVKKPG